MPCMHAVRVEKLSSHPLGNSSRVLHIFAHGSLSEHGPGDREIPFSLPILADEIPAPNRERGRGGGFSRKQTIVWPRAWREGGFLLQRGERIQNSSRVRGRARMYRCGTPEYASNRLHRSSQPCFHGQTASGHPHLIDPVGYSTVGALGPRPRAGTWRCKRVLVQKRAFQVTLRSEPSCHAKNTSFRLAHKVRGKTRRALLSALATVAFVKRSAIQVSL
jgi:hypothetical protein